MADKLKRLLISLNIISMAFNVTVLTISVLIFSEEVILFSYGGDSLRDIVRFAALGTACMALFGIAVSSVGLRISCLMKATPLMTFYIVGLGLAIVIHITTITLLANVLETIDGINVVNVAIMVVHILVNCSLIVAAKKLQPPFEPWTVTRSRATSPEFVADDMDLSPPSLLCIRYQGKYHRRNSSFARQIRGTASATEKRKRKMSSGKALRKKKAATRSMKESSSPRKSSAGLKSGTSSKVHSIITASSLRREKRESNVDVVSE